MSGCVRQRSWRRESTPPSLLEALRRRRSPPESRLAEVGLVKGMRVADVGAGYGYYALPAADAVGGEGMLYAVEPDRKRAEEISRRAKERGLENVRVLVTGGEDLSGIPTGEVDLAMSVSSFHHLADPRKALLEMRRVVKPGGRVYLRDMKPGRVFKHGSRGDQFRAAVSEEFPGAEFEEGPGYIVARAKL